VILDAISSMEAQNAQYRSQPNHVGVAPAGSWAGPDLVVAWQSDPLAVGTYSASKSSPAIDQDRIYIGVDDGTLKALDRETGTVIWSFETNQATVERLKPGTNNRGVHSSPAFDQDHVYIGDYGGRLYAVDKTDGELVWKRKLGGSIGASPVLHGGLVFISVEYAPTNGRAFALDTETGEVAWRSEYLGHHPHGSTTLDVERNQLYLGANNGRFYAFDLATGEAAWRFDTGAEIKSTAALVDDVVYITSWDRHLYAVNAETGAEIFAFQVNGRSMSSPTVSDGRVWFGSHDHLLRCLDSETGEQLWASSTNGAIVSSPTLIRDTGIVLVGSNDNNLYLFDAESGQRLARYELTENLTGVPVVVDGTVFVYDDTGVMWRFDTVDESGDTGGNSG
jgi:outer membrane protein assembly factor BamB